MRVAVFGSGGRLGRRVVEELLSRDHLVRAFIHNNNPFQSHERLEIICGDVRREKDVLEALDGVSMVIASLGSWGAAQKNVSTAGTANIVPAMKARNLRRIVSVTGSAAYYAGDGDSPHPYLRVRREMMLTRAPELLADGEGHLEILHKSDLDWTVVRTPMMQDLPDRQYKLSHHPPPPDTIAAYRSVAVAMVDLTPSQQWSREAPFIR